MPCEFSILGHDGNHANEPDLDRIGRKGSEGEEKGATKARYSGQRVRKVEREEEKRKENVRSTVREPLPGHTYRGN